MNDNGGRASGHDFPCASLAEALPHLRRPPTPEAVCFKIQTVAGDAAQIAPYVDARLVFDRLDLVCGERWRPSSSRCPSRCARGRQTATASPSCRRSTCAAG